MVLERNSSEKEGECRGGGGLQYVCYTRIRQMKIIGYCNTLYYLLQLSLTCPCPLKSSDGVYTTCSCYHFSASWSATRSTLSTICLFTTPTTLRSIVDAKFTVLAIFLHY